MYPIIASFLIDTGYKPVILIKCSSIDTYGGICIDKHNSYKGFTITFKHHTKLVSHLDVGNSYLIKLIKYLYLDKAKHVPPNTWIIETPICHLK